MNDHPLILVDASSLLFRAYHAFNLSTSKGFPTGAIKGTDNMLTQLREKYTGSNIVVVFDASVETFRKELYPQYKANRPPMPQDLREQKEYLLNLIEAQGYPLLQIPKVEADDVIATLAIQAKSQGFKVVIATKDKDLAQLVDDQIKLDWDGKLMDATKVKEKYGVAPNQIVDFLALTGDSSDNIPGVPKVGEKTACALLNTLTSLDNIYENLDKVAELKLRGAKTLGKKLEENKELALLSRELVILKKDVQLQPLSELKMQPPNIDNVLNIYKELEFGLNKLPSFLTQQTDTQATTQATQQNAYIVDETTQHTFLQQLEETPLLILDVIPSHPKNDAPLAGLAFAGVDNKNENLWCAYFPFPEEISVATSITLKDRLKAPYNDVFEKLITYLEDEHKSKLGHDLKTVWHYLRSLGVNLRGIRYDTMIEAHLLHSASRTQSLAALSGYLLPHPEQQEDAPTKSDEKLHLLADYANARSAAIYELHDKQWSKLEALPSLQELFHDMEMPLIEVLASMEDTGVLIDKTQLKQQSDHLAQRLEDYEKEVYQLADNYQFNLNSPKQVAHVLYDVLGLPLHKKTPKKQPSTSEETLKGLTRLTNHPLPELLLQHRHLSKLKSGYLDSLSQQLDDTGRVHTSYNQTITVTGRLSSSNPGLQNIPIRTPEGRNIRSAFVARPNFVILTADYSQIELRIMAHLSKDKSLLAAFHQDLDIHRATAAEIFDIPLEEVDDEQRRKAKGINFGLIYGMSPIGLARQLDIEFYEAKKYHQLYFERYPKVLEFMTTIREQAHEQQYVETFFGRRVYLPDINAANKRLQAAAERAAINAPMQGTAADITKNAMLKMHRYIKDEKMDKNVFMIMQVHDELVFEIAEGQQELMAEVVNQQMASAAKLDVPLKVNVGIGENWQEAH